jgi:protease-4
LSNQGSVFSSAARAFFGALFGLLGVFVGILVVVIILATLVFSGTREVKVTGKYTVLPDADGKRKELTHTSPLILNVNINGIIGSKLLDADLVRDQLERSQQGMFGDGRIRGVLLSINSPGGGVFASDAIYRLIKLYREHYRVPVYAYVDGLCASGGFYIACAANKVYASEVSVIGSVGVLSNHFNFSDTLEKVGAKSLLISRGAEKAPLNPWVPWKEGADKEAQRLIENFYTLFVDIVTTNRPEIKRETLVEEYGARVYPAQEALKKGYIDGLAESREHILQVLVQDVGLDGQFYQVVEMQKRTWIDQLFEACVKSPSLLPQEGYQYLYDEKALSS